MFEKKSPKKQEVGTYVKWSWTITHFNHWAPFFDWKLKAELEQARSEIRNVVVGYFHWMPISDQNAPELQGGYSEK